MRVRHSASRLPPLRSHLTLPLAHCATADLDVDTSSAARPDANASSSPASSAAVSDENVATVASMGIPEAHARFALSRTVRIALLQFSRIYSYSLLRYFLRILLELFP